MREIDRKRDEILSKAGDEAAEQKKQMLRGAREETEQSRKKWREALENEKSSILDTLRNKTAQQVFQISRQALNDLAGADVQDKMIDRFLERFSEFNRDKVTRLKNSISDNKGRILIESSFEISGKVREKLTKLVKKRLDVIEDVDYSQKNDMVCGIALNTGDNRMECC